MRPGDARNQGWNKPQQANDYGVDLRQIHGAATPLTGLTIQWTGILSARYPMHCGMG